MLYKVFCSKVHARTTRKKYQITLVLYKKYYMEQGHYNPKIRVIKINDKNK